jgi:hypothetical protein
VQKNALEGVIYPFEEENNPLILVVHYGVKNAVNFM